MKHWDLMGNMNINHKCIHIQKEIWTCSQCTGTESVNLFGIQFFISAKMNKIIINIPAEERLTVELEEKSIV